MNYINEINKLINKIPKSLIDLSEPDRQIRRPTQASSNFITNKAQGDWAEKIVTDAINNTSQSFVAVKYGRSDDIIAGDDGFPEFFEEFRCELEMIGKRPDILIFRKEDFQ